MSTKTDEENGHDLQLDMLIKDNVVHFRPLTYLVICVGVARFRVVTHYQITEDDVHYALAFFQARAKLCSLFSFSHFPAFAPSKLKTHQSFGN